MKSYHLFFYILQIIILIIIALIYLKYFPQRYKLLIIIDFVFKLAIAIFIILFFLYKKNITFCNHDKAIMVMSGFIFILLIDYIEVINVITQK